MLDGTPAATLAAWLDELMPPESYSHSMERGKRDGIRAALVERLAESDPSALAAWLLRVPSGHMGGDWLKTCVRALLEQNPADAAPLLKKLENLDGYTASLKTEWLAERDPEAAFREVAADRRRQMPVVLAKWLAADPVRALAFANEQPERCYAVLSAFATLGRAELEQFSTGLTSPEAQKQARRFLLSAAATEGDTVTMARLLEQDGRNQNDSFQDTAFSSLVRLHPDKAEQLIAHFSARREVAVPLLNELAGTHPVRAAAILQSGSAPPEYWQAMHPLSRSWSLSDPAAAQAWLRQLPEELRAKAMPVARDITDDFTASEWMDLSRGLTVTVNTAGRYAGQVLEQTKDPAVLADWCASFPDESRGQLLHALRQRMGDPAAADEIARRVQETLAADPQ